MTKPSSFTSVVPVPSEPVLVVGDVICDHYVWGDVERISPEAPVQVLRWEREADRPGGAANAAMNLAALGCRVHLVGLVGDDPAGRWLRETLRSADVDTSGLVVVRGRPTTLKTRIIARGQHMLRIDREVRGTPEPSDERRMIAAIGTLKRISGVTCSDYQKGALTSRVLAAVTSHRAKPFVVVDPKGRDFLKYKGANLLTPNEKELVEATDGAHVGPGQAAIERRAQLLMKRLSLEALLVTRGPDGMDLFERSQSGVRRTHVPALQRHEVFDVTGAGDTAAAVVTMGAAAGLALADAVRLANAAAGLVVGMVGTAAVDRETLVRMLDGEGSQIRAKVVSRNAAATQVASAKTAGERVVFTSGAFESLTTSVLNHLQQARARGDRLIVGVDRRTARATERAELVAALRFVDYVVLFDEPTPARLVSALRPDVVVAPIPPGR